MLLGECYFIAFCLFKSSPYFSVPVGRRLKLQLFWAAKKLLKSAHSPFWSKSICGYKPAAGKSLAGAVSSRGVIPAAPFNGASGEGL